MSQTVQVGAQPAFDIRPLNSVGRTDAETFGTWLGAEHYAARYSQSNSVIGWRARCTTTLPAHVGTGVTEVGNAVATYTGELLVVEGRELAAVRTAFTAALRGSVDFTQ